MSVTVDWRAGAALGFGCGLVAGLVWLHLVALAPGRSVAVLLGLASALLPVLALPRRSRVRAEDDDAHLVPLVDPVVPAGPSGHTRAGVATVSEPSPARVQAMPARPPVASSPVAGGDMTPVRQPARAQAEAPTVDLARQSQADASAPSMNVDRRDPRPRTERILAAWDTYRREGDGRFIAAGLRAQLEALDVAATVSEPGSVGLSEGVLLVELADDDGLVYLLPDFTLSPRAVTAWFEVSREGPRLARTRHVLRPAVARRKGRGVALQEKGVVE